MGVSSMQEAYKLQRRMLTASGTWPKRNPSFFYKLRGVLNFLIILIVTLTLIIPCIYFTDFSKLIQSWAMFVSLGNCCLKFAMFFYKFPVLLDLLDFIHNNPHFTYYDKDLDPHILKVIKISRFIVRFFFCCAISTVISFTFAPLVSSKPRELPLPFPVTLTQIPFSLYIFLYLFQLLGLFLAGWTTNGCDNLAITMMNLSSAYFKILRSTIHRTTDIKTWLGSNDDVLSDLVEFYGKFDGRINEKLCLCVEHHLALIRFTESIESIFSNLILMQFLASLAGICLAGFTFINTPVKSYEFAFALSLLFTLMFQISLYCTFGNEVTIQSSQIGDACYMTKWVGCGPLVRKSLFLIMERSKRPLVLTAGKFIQLSLESLVAIFKSAVSYGAVLKELYSE